jgi:hypothetical protein
MPVAGGMGRGVAYALAIALVLVGPGVGSAGDRDDVGLPRLELSITPQERPRQFGPAPNYDDVPLPRDRIQITLPDPSIPAEVASFSGRWYGKWRPGPYGILIVTKIYPRDEKGRFPVEAFYSAGSVNILAQWVAQPGFIEPSGGVAKGTLVLAHGSQTIAFRFLAGGTELEGRYERSAREIQRYGLFTREPPLVD